jgi:hypothetical protein
VSEAILLHYTHCIVPADSRWRKFNGNVPAAGCDRTCTILRLPREASDMAVRSPLRWKPDASEATNIALDPKVRPRADLRSADLE